MRVAVTGASGLIGRAVVERLASEGVSLTCLSRREHLESPNGIKWLIGDLSTGGVAESLVENQDVIIHLAHDSTPLTATTNLVEGLQSGLFPTLRLISAAMKSAHAPHIIYVSSGGAVYGEAACVNRPNRETDRCEPIMAYGIQKFAIERYLHSAAKSGALRSTVLRVSNAYGALLNPNRLQGIIGTSISRVMEGKALRLIGSPHNVRDYVHISDIATAVNSSLQLTGNFEIINIGSGVGHSVLEVLKKIIQIGGNATSIEIEEVAGSNLLPSWCVLDVNKVRDLLDWKACITLDEGISLMFAITASRRKQGAGRIE
jgi:UDP-glucose 4-epimerase